MAIHKNLIPVDQHHESGFFKVQASSERHCDSFKCKCNNFKGDYPNIVQALHREDWECMFRDADLETCLYRLYNTINRITEKFVPKASTRPKSFPVWFTHKLRSVVSSKKAAHAQWKCSGSLGDYIEFKRLRAACIRLSRTSYRDYVANVEANSARDPKYFWPFVNKLKSSNRLPSSLFLCDSTATCDSEITTLFANHFSSVYSHPALVDLAESDCDIVLDTITVTASDDNSMIYILDDSVKSGPDLVPPYLSKRCPQLVEPLLALFNRSLSECTFPNAWKTAYLYPIHKKGNKQDVENYRPTSILSCFSKLLDSCF